MSAGKWNNKTPPVNDSKIKSSNELAIVGTQVEYVEIYVALHVV